MHTYNSTEERTCSCYTLARQPRGKPYVCPTDYGYRNGIPKIGKKRLSEEEREFQVLMLRVKYAGVITAGVLTP